MSRVFKSSVAILLSLIALALMWCAWCYYTYPCLDVASDRCVEFAEKEDLDNPQITDIYFSFLEEPGVSVYPALSRYRNQEGGVVISLVIDERGKITSKSILESSGYELLNGAAMDSVDTFKVDLGGLKGSKFPVYKNVKITYKLSDSRS
ncbi:energy transducer TonB [Teredinibacter turnerae]|uniref:energy transducer TonB n=1 Tax=Teredinibacter turnerae TaxID=2426 RepID=UPI0030D515B0